jgi:hypothetical protein
LPLAVESSGSHDQGGILSGQPAAKVQVRAE